MEADAERADEKAKVELEEEQAYGEKGTGSHTEHYLRPAADYVTPPQVAISPTSRAIVICVCS
jgi:hypothetical protein